MTRALKIALLAGLLAFSPLVSDARERPPFVEVEVRGVTLDAAQNPIVILEEKEERNIFPIAIGFLEASAIARELEKISPPRPMTHELLHGILVRMKVKVKEVKITELKNSAFHALLVLASEKEVITVDSRPSDAIILALKSKAPILVSTRILEEHALTPVREGGLEPQYGMRVQSLTPSLAVHFKFKGQKGVLVSEIISGTPAETSGIKAGDIITKIGEREVGKPEDFERALAPLKEAGSIRISVFRDGKSREVRLSLKP